MEHSSTIKADIIFAGAGLAGLTLALECARKPFFKDKKMVLIDRDDKKRNDRTWCFWAKADEPLPAFVHKTWAHCQFFGEGIAKKLDIVPYSYHMVRGLDFYEWAKKQLAEYPNVQRINANILGLDADQGVVQTDAGEFQGDWVLNSAFYEIAGASFEVDGARYAQDYPQSPPSFERAAFTHLLQHFKGWVVETPAPVFDPASVTFMDYRLEQHGETRFVYVLPLSETRALVEFTVFSPALCSPEAYDGALRQYLTNILKVNDFKLIEEEFGVIPMTDFPLSPGGGGRVVNIGTAGGFVKASSGYAFLRTQRKLRAFAEDWASTGVPNPSVLQSAKGYRALDSIMLRVLREGSVPGKSFFSLLFRKLPAPLVFRFLDEEASMLDIIRVLSAPPTWPFFKTALRQWPFLLQIFRSKS